jgi:hypothetical protein
LVGFQGHAQEFFGIEMAVVLGGGLMVKAIEWRIVFSRTSP